MSTMRAALFLGPNEMVLREVGRPVAGPGEVLVSQTVRDLVAGSGLVFEDGGMHALKGVPNEWHLFRANLR